MKQFVVHTILFSLLLVGCASKSANAQAQGEPVFSVVTKNNDDQITFQFKDNAVFIEIQSPVGIGSAIFTLEAGDMPEIIVVQIHMKGLEEFKILSDQVVLSASIPSSEGIETQSQRKISENNDQALRSSDALWMDIQIVSESKKIPLQDGYFEIVIPQEFIQQVDPSFEIQWVDFYR